MMKIMNSPLPSLCVCVGAEQHLQSRWFFFLLLTATLFAALFAAFFYGLALTGLGWFGSFASLGRLAGLAGPSRLDTGFGLCAVRLGACAAAGLEVVFVKDTGSAELARDTRGDELAVNRGTRTLSLDVGDATAPPLDTAELSGLEFIELELWFGCRERSGRVDSSASGYGRCDGHGSLLGVVGLDLLDDLVAAQRDDSDTNGDTASDHELRAQEQGGDGGEAALERHEHARAHLADDGADLGKGEGDGGKGLGVLLQVLNGLGDGELQTLGLLEQHGDLGGFLLELDVVVLLRGQRRGDVTIGQVHVYVGLRLAARRLLHLLVRVASRNLPGVCIACIASEVQLEAVFARPRAVVCVEAVGVATVHARARRLYCLGAMRCLGVLGAVRRCARLDIIVEADRLDALAELLRLVGSLLLGLELCFALAVGGLGLLEDADEVLALRRSLVRGLSGGPLSATHTAHNLARLVNDSDGFSNSNGHGGERAMCDVVMFLQVYCNAGGMSCDQMPGCGVLLDVQVFEAVKNDQCFGNGRQAALHKVHLITSLIAALRQDR
jgi:hypothetical protein